MQSIGFAKGHGTLNDFVIVLDRSNFIPLSTAQVRHLCDRRAGIGADGLIRVTRAKFIPEWDGDPELWFMDYRNADGSIAEMCGNGLRVFGRYLYDEGLTTREPVTVATRAGLRRISPLPDGTFEVTMGPANVAADLVEVTVAMSGHTGDAGVTLKASPVDVGNPHAVAFLEAGADGEVPALEALNLTRQPVWTPPERFPGGVNCEFVQVLGPDQLRMRVHERGSGETMSCGTGIVASAAAYAARTPESSGRIMVDVPGGRLRVDLTGDDALLAGPAVIVAKGDVTLAPTA